MKVQAEEAIHLDERTIKQGILDGLVLLAVQNGSSIQTEGRAMAMVVEEFGQEYYDARVEQITKLVNGNETTEQRKERKRREQRASAVTSFSRNWRMDDGWRSNVVGQIRLTTT